MFLFLSDSIISDQTARSYSEQIFIQPFFTEIDFTML